MFWALLIISVMLIEGCSSPTTYPAPTGNAVVTAQSKYALINQTPTDDFAKDKETYITFLKMYDQDIKLAHKIEPLIGKMRDGNIHIFEIYKGSLIFYGKNYGYFYIPDSNFKEFENIKCTSRDDLFRFSKSHSGIKITVFDTSGYSFDTANDAETFITDLSVDDLCPPSLTVAASEEVKVYVQWLKMVGWYKEENDEAINEDMVIFKEWGVKPIKVWRGAIIFSSEDYGYFWMSNYDLNYRAKFYKARTAIPGTEFWGSVAQRHKGDISITKFPFHFSSEGGAIASFKELKDAQDFISELSILMVDYPVTVYPEN